MKESDTYQAIVEEGEVKRAKLMLLRLGRTRFGVPSAAQESALHAITDLERLERLTDRLLQVESWQELLATT